MARTSRADVDSSGSRLGPRPGDMPVARAATGRTIRVDVTQMKNRSPDVDAYIAAAPAYARPILTRIRAAFHAGCPDLQERLKWRTPSFEYEGLLGGMAAFKAYVTFGFWKSALMADFHATYSGRPRATMFGERVESLAGLPARTVLIDYVREARRLNEEGVQEPRPARPKRPIRVAVPPDLAAALARNARAGSTFASFAPSHRRDYVEWVTEAKREETRKRRVATAVEWLAEGKRRNWKYE
jgi:uncharacterized protein YdeI (YjbR/CyaY-like superfamily)